jgi:uncharacterized glyoxalase superfamily protein PhnB
MHRNRSMPQAAVIPVLSYDDVQAASSWLSETFGFRVRWEAGKHRAQLGYGNGAVAITARARHREGTEGKLPQPTHKCSSEVMVRVEEVNAHFEHAKRRGAKILAQPQDYPYGERQYSVEDPEGNRWTFSQTIADVPPEEWGGTSRDLEA